MTPLQRETVAKLCILGAVGLATIADLLTEGKVLRSVTEGTRGSSSRSRRAKDRSAIRLQR